MYSYTATIGRNVPSNHGSPMSDLDWSTFEDDVTEALLSGFPCHRHLTVEVHRGIGTWDGVTEESVKVTVLSPAQLPDVVESCYDVLHIRSELRERAAFYGQDAIALTIGTSELILSQDR